jgi:hypothetical protein
MFVEDISVSGQAAVRVDLTKPFILELPFNVRLHDSLDTTIEKIRFDCVAKSSIN